MKITDVRAHVLRSPLAQPFAFSLFADQPLLEFDTSAHPFREHLTDAPLRHRNGWIDVPQRPGLGIEVSREVMAKFGVQEKPNGARGG